MPNRPSPTRPARIYTVTQIDHLTIEQAAETLQRSIRILNESRSVTSRIGHWNSGTPPPTVDRDDEPS